MVKSLEYNFGNNLRKVINFSTSNGREYIKNDAKYLIVPFILLFSLIFALVDSIWIFFTSTPYNYAILRSGISIFLVLLVIFLIWVSYIINWLIQSKSYHVLELYQNPSATYKNTLNVTVKSRLRVFVGIFISGTISGSIILATYVILILFLFFTANRGPSFISILPFFIYLDLIPILIITFLLLPLQIYPSVLLIEKDLSYINGIKRSFKILTGWTNKLKFFVLNALLMYIVNFITEFLLFGFILVGFFGGIILIGTLHLSGQAATILIISDIAFCFSLYTIILMEIDGIVTGNFYGQSYVNLVHPELDIGLVNKAKFQPGYYPQITFCTNCGNQLTQQQLFCPVCGQKK